MRHSKDKPHKTRKFLKIPVYPGGKRSFREFVAENLVYPEEALSKGVQGTVYLEYTVDNIGQVENITVTHGIGHGCDEEAIRLVRLLSYPSVRNRGVKLKVKMKTRIAFVLPAPSSDTSNAESGIKISYSPVKAENPEPAQKQPPKPSYAYTITIHPNEGNL